MLVIIALGDTLSLIGRRYTLVADIRGFALRSKKDDKGGEMSVAKVHICKICSYESRSDKGILNHYKIRHLHKVADDHLTQGTGYINWFKYRCECGDIPHDPMTHFYSEHYTSEYRGCE